jgi:hypothetical protein
MPGREADNSPQSSTEVKNTLSYTSTLPSYSGQGKLVPVLNLLSMKTHGRMEV